MTGSNWHLIGIMTYPNLRSSLYFFFLLQFEEMASVHHEMSKGWKAMIIPKPLLFVVAGLLLFFILFEQQNSIFSSKISQVPILGNWMEEGNRCNWVGCCSFYKLFTYHLKSNSCWREKEHLLNIWNGRSVVQEPYITSISGLWSLLISTNPFSEIYLHSKGT